MTTPNASDADVKTDTKDQFVVEAAVQSSNENCEEVNKIDAGADLALKYLAENEGKFEELSQEEHNKVMRKTDWILLPVLLFTCTMGATDKTILGCAAIFNIREDNHLHGQQYSWLSSILFIGSLIGMWPMSFLVQRFRIGKVMAYCSLAWSSLTFLHAACSSFAGLATLRFLMGLAECCIVPGASLMMTKFYLKKESPHRTAIIFLFLSSVFTGALASLATTFGDKIPTWKYIYLLVGSISFVWSVFLVFYLPDSPIDAKWLSERERYHMVKRVADNATGVENHSWKWAQVTEAFADPRVYLIMLFNFGIQIPNGGLSTYSSIIIKNLGFSSVKSALMGIPTGIIASLSTVFFTWLGSRWTNRRCLVAVLSLVIPLIGSVILYSVDQKKVAPQLVGLYFMYFYFASYIVMMSCVQANTSGSTKKAVTYGFNYLGYCGGAITGTQTFRSNQAPKYTGGFISMIVAYCCCILFAFVYWFISIGMNRQKKTFLEKLEASGEVEQLKIPPQGAVGGVEDEKVMDLTDKEQIHFTYVT